MIDLIYCSGDNAEHARLTLKYGWLVGVRSNKYAYGVPIAFVDNEYRSPNFSQHLEMVKRLHPRYATVPDLSEREVSKGDVNRALCQAEQLAPYCDVIYLVPKLLAQLSLIPHDVPIAYSVPTTYGGVKHLPIELMSALEGRRLHLLSLAVARMCKWSCTAISPVMRRCFLLTGICFSWSRALGNTGRRGSGCGILMPVSNRVILK